MKKLELAIKIAVNAHFDQVDKAGAPYILHPLKVMHNVTTINEKIVAILHDVVEDTEITLADLENLGMPKKCIEALKVLTHNKEIEYMDYIKNLSSNPLAKVVKIADLKDNADLTRLNTITDKDRERAKKYTLAISYLNSTLE